MKHMYRNAVIAAAVVLMMTVTSFAGVASADSENRSVFEEGFSYESTKLNYDDYIHLRSQSFINGMVADVFSTLNIPYLSSSYDFIWDYEVTSFDGAYTQDWCACSGDTGRVFYRTYTIQDTTLTFRATANAQAAGVSIQEVDAQGTGDDEFVAYLGKDTLSEGDVLEVTVSISLKAYDDFVESLYDVGDSKYLRNGVNDSYYRSNVIHVNSATFTSGGVSKPFSGTGNVIIRGVQAMNYTYTDNYSKYSVTTVDSDVEHTNSTTLRFDSSDHAFSFLSEAMNITTVSGDVVESMYVNLRAMDVGEVMEIYFTTADVPVKQFLESHGKVDTGYIRTYRSITEHYESEFAGITVAEDALSSVLMISAVLTMIFVLIIIALVAFMVRRRSIYLKSHEPDDS